MLMSQQSGELGADGELQATSSFLTFDDQFHLFPRDEPAPGIEDGNAAPAQHAPSLARPTLPRPQTSQADAGTAYAAQPMTPQAAATQDIAAAQQRPLSAPPLSPQDANSLRLSWAQQLTELASLGAAPEQVMEAASAIAALSSPHRAGPSPGTFRQDVPQGLALPPLRPSAAQVPSPQAQPSPPQSVTHYDAWATAQQTLTVRTTGPAIPTYGGTPTVLSTSPNAATWHMPTLPGAGGTPQGDQQQGSATRRSFQQPGSAGTAGGAHDFAGGLSSWVPVAAAAGAGPHGAPGSIGGGGSARAVGAGSTGRAGLGSKGQWWDGHGGGGTTGDSAAHIAAQQQEIERLQSHVTALDANNQELQRRVSELTSRLDQSQTEAQKHKLGEQNVRDTLMEWEGRMKAREVHFQAADKQLAAVTGELQSARTALAKEQAAHRGAADEVVRWKAECQTLSKELDNASKKLQTLGLEERRLQTELMTLKRDNIVLNDTLMKTRVELGEARDKSRQALKEAERHMGAATRLELGTEGMVAQVTALRHKVAELEGRNAALLDEVRSMRAEQQFSHAHPHTRGHTLESQRTTQLTSNNTNNNSQRPAGRASIGGDSAAIATRRGVAGQWQADGAAMAAVLRDPAGGAGPGPTSPALVSPGRAPYPAHSPHGALQGQQARAQQGQAGGVAGLLHDDWPGAQIESQPLPTQTHLTMPYGHDYPRQPLPTHEYDGPLHTTSTLTHNTDKPYTQPPQRTAPWASPPHSPGGRMAGAAGVPGGVGEMRGVSSAWEWQSGVGGVGAREPSPTRHATAADNRPQAGRYNPYNTGPIHDTTHDTGALHRYYQQQHPTDFTHPPPDTHAPRPWQLDNTNQEQTGRAASPPRVGGVGVDGDVRGSYERSGQQMAGVGATGAGAAAGAYGAGASLSPDVSSPTDQALRTPGLDVPYGTDRTLKDLLERSRAMEDRLMHLCVEKTQLDSEIARMPSNSSRNGRLRARKAEAEDRLDQVNKEISNLRLGLKRMHQR